MDRARERPDRVTDGPAPQRRPQQPADRRELGVVPVQFRDHPLAPLTAHSPPSADRSMPALLRRSQPGSAMIRRALRRPIGDAVIDPANAEDREMIGTEITSNRLDGPSREALWAAIKTKKDEGRIDQWIAGRLAGGGQLAVDAVQEVVRFIRQDDDFRDTLNYKDKTKTHVDDSGNLVPTQVDGPCTPLEHVYGSEPRKHQSRYTSFMTVAQGVIKTYGAQEVEVRIDALRAAIQDGSAPGLSIVGSDELAGSIRAEMLDMAPTIDIASMTMPPEEIEQKVAEMVTKGSLSRKNASRLSRRLLAYSNTTRDREILVAGVIPARFLLGPTGEAKVRVRASSIASSVPAPSTAPEGSPTPVGSPSVTGTGE